MSSNEQHADQPALWDEPTGKSTPPRRRTRRRADTTPQHRPTESAEPQHPSDGERLWTAADVAVYLGVPIKTVYAWRSRGRGPKGFRIGKHLRWRVATVFEWSLEQERKQ